MMRESTLEAYRRARVRAVAAQQVESDLLRMASYEAKEVGLSIREAAGLLGVPKSTLARSGASRDDFPPAGYDEEEWLSAWNSAWAGDVTQQVDQAPFEVEDCGDGTQQMRRRSWAEMRGDGSVF